MILPSPQLIFLPRDAMCNRGTSRRSVSVRQSVRHSHALHRNG